MAAHATDIIANAKLYDTTRNAIADLNYVYASTARDRRVNKPQITPREMAGEILEKGNIGILFGPERSGLQNEDIALANAIVTIPTDEKNSSLNIAQAAVVIGYELWTHFSFLSQKTVVLHESKEVTATHSDINGFLDQLEDALDETGFFKVEDKKPRMWQNLRSTFLKTSLTNQDVQTLRGVVSSLRRK